MSKTSIDKKYVRNYIRNSRAMGKTNQEIYNELEPNYFDKKGLVLLITGTVREETKVRFNYLNIILVTLLSAAALINIIAGWLYYMYFKNTINVINFPLFILIPLWFITLAVLVAQFNAGVYRSTIIAAFFSAYLLIEGFQMGAFAAIAICINVLIVVLAIYLYGRLFPDYNPHNIIKDKDGNYKLDN